MRNMRVKRTFVGNCFGSKICQTIWKFATFMQWHDTFLFTIKETEKEGRERGREVRELGLSLWKCCQTYFTYIFLSSFVSFLTGNNLTKWIGQEAGEKDCQVRERWSEAGGEGNLNAIVQQQQQISCGTLATNGKNEKLFLYQFLQLIKPTQVNPPPLLHCPCTALHKSI